MSNPSSCSQKGLSSQSVASAAMLLIGISMLSKGLGLVREMLVAHSFGLGPELDAYLVAVSIPFFVVNIFGVAMATALIPLLNSVITEHGGEGVRSFSATVFGTAGLGALALSGLIFILADRLVDLSTASLDPYTRDTAIWLVKLLSLIVVAGFIYHASTAMYQARNHFMIPSVADLTSNFFVIGALVFLVGAFGIGALAGGMLAGMVFVAVVLIAALYHHGLLGAPSGRWMGRVKELGSMSAPVALFSVFLYGNIFIENYFGSSLPSGSISALGYARRINEVVLTLIAANIARAVFPTLARYHNEGTKAEACEIVHKIGVVMLFWLVPVSAGLVVFSEDVVRIAFMRGAFDARALELTSGALRFYSLGLLFSSGTLILIRLSYATMDVYLPLKAAAIGVICMVGAGMFLKALMGVSGISLAVSLAAFVTFSALFLLLRSKGARLSFSRLGRALLLTTGSAALASLAFVTGPGKGLSIFIKGPAFCALYFVLCFALMRAETMQALMVLRGRLEIEGSPEGKS